MTAQPELSVVVVNYNGAEWLPGCLDSLRRNVAVCHEVILVDNASTDRSLTLVRERYPEVRIVANDRNAGFAAGNNLGVSNARAGLLLLLNNDTVLLDDPGPAMKLLEADPRIGVVGGRMLGAKSEYRASAGFFPSPMRLVKITSMYERRGPFRDGEFPPSPPGYPVDWVEGSFMLTSAALWSDLGGMDEGYFMYGEDVDYCKQALLLGRLTFYCPHVRYVHHGGFDVERMVWTVDGFRRFHRKHSGPFRRLLAAGVLGSGLLARAAVSGLRYVFSRRPEQKARARVCWTALRGRS